MINVSVKARPSPRLPIDPCYAGPVAQTFWLVGKAINQVPTPAPCSQMSGGSRACTHKQAGWSISPPPSRSAHPAPQEQELLIGHLLPFQMENPPSKGGKAAVMNSWLTQGLSLAHRSVTTGSTSSQTSIDTKTGGPANRLCAHPSFPLLVLLRCPVWSPVATREERPWRSVGFPDCKSAEGKSPYAAAFWKNKNLGVGPKHF